MPRNPTIALIGAVLCIVLLFSGGCGKSGPIDLTDDQSPVDLIPVEKPASPILTTADIDSLQYFPMLNEQATAHLLLEASEFDALNIHHEAVLARALFFDALSPIYLPQDTLFRLLDAGTVTLDLLSLREAEKRYYNPASGVDTLLGIQYLLYAVDGVGGRGISYDEGRTYTWSGTGATPTPRFTIPVIAPKRIHVKTPTPATSVKFTSNLTVQWDGGSDTVDIHIRSWDATQFRAGKILFQLRLNSNTGSTVIPRSVLGILPRNQGQFLFTFTSSKSTLVPIAGFPDGVLAQVVTTHNMVIQIRP